MKLAMVCALVLVGTTNCFAASYKDELKIFEKSPTHAMVFDEDAHEGLKSLRRDIEAYPKLSNFQRMILSSLEIILVTDETMPGLYGYIADACQENKIKMPTVFIATNKGFFNALALRLFWGTGIVVIGKKIIEDASQEELEGVLAHELGHIKYDHGTKKFAIFIGSFIGASLVANQFIENPYAKAYAPHIVAPLLTSLLINKRFEREADEFAYKTVGKGKGLAQFFKHLEKMEEKTEGEFAATYQMLADHKHNLEFFDYTGLLIRYYVARGFHKLGDAYKWIYHNTFLGDHPSHQDRIKAIEAHLAKQ